MPTETRKEKTERTFLEVQQILKVSTYEILERVTSSILKAKCRECGDTRERHLYYFRKYRCVCQRQKDQLERAKNSSSFSTERMLKNLSKQKIRVITKKLLLRMNKRVTAECLRCGHIWKPIFSNLRIAGCPEPDCSKLRAKKKSIKKYGVAHSAQRPEVREKIKSTMLKRYGAEHALQNKELFDKNLITSYNHKEYKLGRKIVLIQGYEPQALDYLLASGISPSQIRCGIGCKGIPSIPYTFERKKHVYHPDIYIPHLNLIVEVKSTFTQRQKKKVNTRKRKACLEAGFEFKILVMRRNGSLVKEKSYA